MSGSNKGESIYEFEFSSLSVTTVRWNSVFTAYDKTNHYTYAKGTALSNSIWLLLNFSIMAIKCRSQLSATNPALINCGPIFKSLLWSQKWNHEQCNGRQSNLFGYLSRRNQLSLQSHKHLVHARTHAHTHTHTHFTLSHSLQCRKPYAAT